MNIALALVVAVGIAAVLDRILTHYESTVKEEWLRFVPVREIDADVYHRATGAYGSPRGTLVHCGAVIGAKRAAWHFGSALGIGWNRSIEACPDCEAAYRAAGSPPTAMRVPGSP